MVIVINIFQLNCAVRHSNKRAKTIPIIVRVSDINDNAPKFINTPYSVNVSEVSNVGFLFLFFPSLLLRKIFIFSLFWQECTDVFLPII